MKKIKYKIHEPHTISCLQLSNRHTGYVSMIRSVLLLIMFSIFSVTGCSTPRTTTVSKSQFGGLEYRVEELENNFAKITDEELIERIKALNDLASEVSKKEGIDLLAQIGQVSEEIKKETNNRVKTVEDLDEKIAKESNDRTKDINEVKESLSKIGDINPQSPAAGNQNTNEITNIASSI